MPKTLLIDGHNIANIYWHAYGKQESDNGYKMGVIVGTFSLIHQLMQEFNPDAIVVAYDPPNSDAARSWRYAQFADYKKTRRDCHEKETSEQQEERKHFVTTLITDTRNALLQLGVAPMRCKRREADDLLAALTYVLPGEKIIVSTDGDLIQCVRQNVRVYNQQKRAMYYWEDDGRIHSDVDLKWEPQTAYEYLWRRALCGDSSDSIPGLKGIGPVKAAQQIGYDAARGRVMWQAPRIVFTETLTGRFSAAAAVQVCRNFDLMRLDKFDAQELRRIQKAYAFAVTIGGKWLRPGYEKRDPSQGRSFLRTRGFTLAYGQHSWEEFIASYRKLHARQYDEVFMQTTPLDELTDRQQWSGDLSVTLGSSLKEVSLRRVAAGAYFGV